MLAKSAASSSLASGFTCDHQGGKGGGLSQPQFAAAGQFKEREQCRQHFPRLGGRTDDVVPARPRPQLEHGADGSNGAVDVQGARQIRASGIEDLVTIFVVPPSFEVLEARLRGRNTDSEAAIERRLDVARDEMEERAAYDHVVVNGELEDAVSEIRRILERRN